MLVLHQPKQPLPTHPPNVRNILTLLTPQNQQINRSLQRSYLQPVKIPPESRSIPAGQQKLPVHTSILLQQLAEERRLEETHCDWSLRVEVARARAELKSRTWNRKRLG
uniref:(northern house mosquito) hypothetical protein n=1 Tax=Culex pipiens TaxID=7175 RepID=A0A8D8HJR0_CULPI